MKPIQTCSKPAPGDLAIVQALINSRLIDTGIDYLETPLELQTWLQQFELLEHSELVSTGDLQKILQIREALRKLLLTNTKGAEVVLALNQATVKSPLVVSFTTTGEAHLISTAKGIHGTLGRLFTIVLNSMADGSWPRLKACLNDECQWVYYDQSKNHTGTWCSMAACGSRMKARSYRRRKAQRDN